MIVDRLTKSSHFILVKCTRTVTKLAELYVCEVVRLHGIPKNIVSDRDPLFKSEFWQGLEKALGTQLCLSTAYHLHTDGLTKRVNRMLEDLLRACMIDFVEPWVDHLHQVEFAYDSSYQSTFDIALFKDLYRNLYNSPSCWWEIRE